MTAMRRVMERNRSFTLYMSFRLSCWCLAITALLSALLTLNCGGVAPAPEIQVSLAPGTAQAVLGGQVKFSATVTGSASGVSWLVNGTVGGNFTVGTIDSTGLYTAPILLPDPNTVTVTAASVTDSTRSATASVTLVNPVPAISSISPATINAGSGNTLLTVTGTGFTSRSTIDLGSTALTTTYWNPTALTARLAAAQLANPASLPVTVTTPTPGGGTSNAVPLVTLAVVGVTPPAQTVMVGQAQQFSVTVNGIPNQPVTWSVNGVVGGDATVGMVGSAGLYTAPTAPPVPNVVTVTATSVTNPTWSGTASVSIVNPTPTISSISPVTIREVSSDTQLTVMGSGFVSQSMLQVNGSIVPANLVSNTQLTATLPVLMLAQSAVFSIVVTNPAPGGGTSSAATLSVLAQGAVSATGNPQVALYSFASASDASVSIEFGTDTTYGLHTWAQSTPTGGGAVEILVAGMKANTTYHMRADVTLSGGNQFTDSDHTYATGGLPSSRVPQTSVTNPHGLSPSPGAILLHLLPGTSNQVMAGAVDNAGNLIWYYDYDASLGIPQPIKLLPNGHMLLVLTPMTNHGGTVQEIDLAGNLISQFTSTDLNNWLSAAGYTLFVNAIHHDILSLPNGHLILLVNHYKNFTDLPGSPGTTLVTGDALVDLDQNHNPVWVWDTFDHLCSATVTTGCLDINRQPLGFPDWTHGNAVVYSPDDGNLILSMRNQGWVIKIDYEIGQGTGDILWRLGNQGDFTLTNGQSPDWFYGQHYPTFVSPNSTGVFNLEVFDDGDGRVLDSQGDVCGASGQPACNTRIPIYQIDEVGMTATILWQDNLAPVYCFFGGSAQQLNDSNVVFGITTPSDDPTGARYMEVTYDPSPQVVLQMEISGQNAYRAVHLPSLYPGVQW